MLSKIAFASLSAALSALAFARLGSAQAPARYSDVEISQFVAEIGLEGDVAQNVTSALAAGLRADSSKEERASRACMVSRVVFGSAYLDSDSAGYVDRVEVNWSDACWLDPRCIVLPTSSSTVSTALRIVTFLKSHFSVRSGGHNPNPGYASVSGDGVLIDLVGLDQVFLSDDGSVAEVGSGNRFGNVYAQLNGTGRSVLGGRIEDVGVGGYYLGGGMAFFSSQYGVAADNIKNFEVVLANSSIVDANEETNADLWWALKGGGANFGIVTRYDINTVPDGDVWFEGRMYDVSQVQDLLAAAVEYSTAAETDLYSGLVFNIFPDSVIVGFIYGKPVVHPPVYNAFYDIPYTRDFVNSTIGNWYDLAQAFGDLGQAYKARYVFGADIKNSYWRMIVSIAHQWDLDVLREGYATYLNISAQVTAGFNGTITFGVQPFQSSAVRYSSGTGGNPLGLTAVAQNWFTSVIEWEDGTNDQDALDAIQALGESIRVSSERHSAALPFRFMNDANHAQDVLASYGGDNVAKLALASQAYDPLRLFQVLQNDGFLLSKSD